MNRPPTSGLAARARRAETIVFALADPSGHRRFGFALAAAFDSPYAGPSFMALALADDPPRNGQVRYQVRYPAAFAALG